MDIPWGGKASARDTWGTCCIVPDGQTSQDIVIEVPEGRLSAKLPAAHRFQLKSKIHSNNDTQRGILAASVHLAHWTLLGLTSFFVQTEAVYLFFDDEAEDWSSTSSWATAVCSRGPQTEGFFKAVAVRSPGRLHEGLVPFGNTVATIWKKMSLQMNLEDLSFHVLSVMRLLTEMYRKDLLDYLTSVKITLLLCFSNMFLTKKVNSNVVKDEYDKQLSMSCYWNHMDSTLNICLSNLLSGINSPEWSLKI